MSVPLRPLGRWLDHDRFTMGILFLTLAVVAGLMPAQNDTWWLLRAGEEMWRTRRVMLHDEFTHTVAGEYWLNHEWGTQVLFYAVYRAGGLPLLTTVCAAAVLTAWVLVSRLTPGPALVRVLLIGLGAALTTAGWSLRAQTLTLACFAATLWMLVRRRHLWLLPILFLLWANLHGAVATGGLLVVAATAAALATARPLVPRLLALGTLCLVALTITPLGVSFWLEIPRSMERARAIGIDEWRAPSLGNPADLPLWVAAAGLAFLAIRRRRALASYEPLTLILASGCLLVLALGGARNVALFFVCAVPAAATLLAWPDPPAPEKAGGSSSRGAVLAAYAAICLAIVLIAWSRPWPRLGWQPLPDGMTDAIASCEGPLYNRYDEGGYLIWFLKGRPVFMDSRQDPFPVEMVRDQLRLEATGDYHPTFQRYGIRCALTPEGSVLARRLAADGWQERTAGPGWRVFAATEGR